VSGLIVHIAGPDVRVDDRLRQRCSWCGALLVDEQVDRLMVPVGQRQGLPPVWLCGSMVAVDGGASWEINTDEDGQLPEHHCGLIDPEVTA
jgi:hypothetical protein